MTASTTDAVKWAALNSNIANGVVGSADAIEAALDDMRTVVDQHASEINITEDSAGVKRQAIINWNFAVNQRVVSGTVTLAAGAYSHDRWKAGASGCTYTFATSANVTTLTITAGSLIQVIEGTSLFTGSYTLSWTGTAQGKIGSGSYGASGITGSVTGGSNLNIEFNTGTLSKVQFNAGSTVLPFQPRSFAEELALCHRYYQAFDQRVRYLDASASVVWSRGILPMRIAPTATITVVSGATPTINTTRTNSIDYIITSSGTTDSTFNTKLDAEL